jgi:hypothetical protein
MVTGRSLFSGRISEETLRAVMERGLDLDAPHQQFQSRFAN